MAGRGMRSRTRAAAAQAVAYVRRGVAALGALPDEKHDRVRAFFDGLGGTQIVIHSPFGMRFNRGLGLALRKRLCQSFDFEIQASAIDDAVLLALNSRHSFPLEQVLAMINSRTAARRSDPGAARCADVRGALPPRRDARAYDHALDAGPQGARMDSAPAHAGADHGAVSPAQRLFRESPARDRGAGPFHRRRNSPRMP